MQTKLDYNIPRPSAPLDASLTPQKRFESSLLLSELITKMATHVICHTLVDFEQRLSDERFSVASAFLQRATSTHLCNYKLTNEGIELRYQGEAFELHEEFKTMTLTRSVYEHLVMFYFLYIHPKTDEERRVVWNYWKINSKKNLLDPDDNTAKEEIESLRRNIFSTLIGMECYAKLDEWTDVSKPAQNGCIAFFCKRNGDAQSAQDVRHVSYNQAWRFLFRSKGTGQSKNQEDMNLLYNHLSIHSHPIYNGLLQYQDQAMKDEGYDGVPLYLSTCFLAYLCRLFLRLLPNGSTMFNEDFSEQERHIFRTLSQQIG